MGMDQDIGFLSGVLWDFYQNNVISCEDCSYGDCRCHYSAVHTLGLCADHVLCAHDRMRERLVSWNIETRGELFIFWGQKQRREEQKITFVFTPTLLLEDEKE